MAVNLLDATESNLLPADTPPGGVEKVIEATGGKVRRELWRILAGVALALLFIEWWVYTRRVHL